MHLSFLCLSTTKTTVMICKQVFFVHFILSPNDVIFCYHSSNHTPMLLIIVESSHINQRLENALLVSNPRSSKVWLVSKSYSPKYRRAQEDALPLHAFNAAFLLPSDVLAHHSSWISKSHLSFEAQVKCSAWGQSSINVLAGSRFNFFWNPITFSISLLAVFNLLLWTLAPCITSAFVHRFWFHYRWHTPIPCL